MFEGNPEDVLDDLTVDRVDGVLILADRSGATVWETKADARYEIGAPRSPRTASGWR